MSTVNLVDLMIPGLVSRLYRWLFKNNRFPWTPVDTELIAFGSGAAVYKLNWKTGAMVLRIYRRSVGKSSCQGLEVAERYKRNYETMLSWYGQSLDLVPPMEFMVLQALPLVGPVAASLQPYIDGEKQDLFEDFSDNELLDLFTGNDYVREQFLYFAHQTIRQWNERNMCFDFLGKRNVMLVTQAGSPKLCLPDYGFFNFDMLANKRPETLARFEERMDRLASLYELTKKIQPVPIGIQEGSGTHIGEQFENRHFRL